MIRDDALFVLLVFVVFSVTSVVDASSPSTIIIPPVSISDPSIFQPVTDTKDNCGRFEASFELPDGSYYQISRVTVECMYYDGPEGYTAFTIRKIGLGMNNISEDLTVFTRGSFLLFGVRLEESILFAYRLRQVGAGDRIANVAVFSPDRTEPEDLPVAPDGNFFTYGKPTPDGEYCILFDHGAVIVDLDNERNPQRLSFDPPLLYHAADPPSDPESNLGGFRLDEKYMRLDWDSALYGVLQVIDPCSETIREIPIAVPVSDEPTTE